jgi:hypothetical protein
MLVNEHCYTEDLDFRKWKKKLESIECHLLGVGEALW